MDIRLHTNLFPESLCLISQMQVCRGAQELIQVDLCYPHLKLHFWSVVHRGGPVLSLPKTAFLASKHVHSKQLKLMLQCSLQRHVVKALGLCQPEPSPPVLPCIGLT